jgi:hypothetical protein
MASSQKQCQINRMQMVATIIERLFDEVIANEEVTDAECNDLLVCIGRLKKNYDLHNDPSDRPMRAKLNDLYRNIEYYQWTRSAVNDPYEMCTPSPELLQSYRDVGSWAASTVGSYLWSASQKLSKLSSMVTSDLKKTLISDNHPWKQKNMLSLCLNGKALLQFYSCDPGSRFKFL